MQYQDILKKLSQSDDRFICVTAENRALIRNLPQEMGDRFIDTGITEQTMIGMAAGLALMGRVPIVHALATFLTLRAFEFIRTDVGIAQLPVKLTGFIPGILSDANGPTHQAIEDISIMRGIPNMQVFAPVDEQDMILMLENIWSSPYPCYLRANTVKSSYVHEPFEIGKAEIISTGEDITFLVYGALFGQVLVAKEILEFEGKSVGIINMRSLSPVDETAILNACKNSELVVTVEDHFLTGGLYSIVAEVLLKNHKTAHVLPIAFENRWFKPGLLSEVLEHEKLTGSHLAQRVTKQLLNLGISKSEEIEV